ncbi:hypothetical protein HanIR_Chr16g0819381 [Helianthus annuus]|nr:hypothetical protein HanIR_Chr16g0819381 [Helianthus annuus]
MEIYSATSRSVRLWLDLGETCLCGPHGGFPLVGLRENGFVAGQAARKEESKKVDKHAKLAQRSNISLSLLPLIHLAP